MLKESEFTVLEPIFLFVELVEEIIFGIIEIWFVCVLLAVTFGGTNFEAVLLTLTYPTIPILKLSISWII